MVYNRIMGTGIERQEGVGMISLEKLPVKHFVYINLSGQILNFLTPNI